MINGSSLRFGNKDQSAFGFGVAPNPLKPGNNAIVCLHELDSTPLVRSGDAMRCQ